MLQYAIKAVLFLTLTVSMVLGASSLISEREENTMESLLLTPVTKTSLAFAKYTSVLMIGILIMMVSVPYLCAIGAGSGLIGTAVFITFFGGLMLLMAFVALAMVFSIFMKSSKAFILTSVLIMIILTLPALIQGIFNLSAIGMLILKVDPVACCFNMMGKMITDKEPFLLLTAYYVPLLLFAAVSIGILYYSSYYIALKGEK